MVVKLNAPVAVPMPGFESRVILDGSQTDRGNKVADT